MARAYTLATVALALGVEAKWLDNVLSHFNLTGVSQSRQGVARRISAEAVLELALIRELGRSLGVPLEKAVSVSRSLVSAGEMQLEEGLSIHLAAVEESAHLAARLEYAVEAAPVPQRGRPARKAKRGAD